MHNRCKKHSVTCAFIRLFRKYIIMQKYGWFITCVAIIWADNSPGYSNIYHVELVPSYLHNPVVGSLDLEAYTLQQCDGAYICEVFATDSPTLQGYLTLKQSGGLYYYNQSYNLNLSISNNLYKRIGTSGKLSLQNNQVGLFIMAPTYFSINFLRHNDTLTPYKDGATDNNAGVWHRVSWIVKNPPVIAGDKHVPPDILEICKTSAVSACTVYKPQNGHDESRGYLLLLQDLDGNAYCSTYPENRYTTQPGDTPYLFKLYASAQSQAQIFSCITRDKYTMVLQDKEWLEVAHISYNNGDTGSVH